MTTSLSGVPSTQTSLSRQTSHKPSGHRRSVSLNVGQSPNALDRSRKLPSAASLDPTYESFHRDSVTQANTLANASGSRPTIASAFSHASAPGFS